MYNQHLYNQLLKKTKLIICLKNNKKLHENEYTYTKTIN